MLAIWFGQAFAGTMFFMHNGGVYRFDGRNLGESSIATVYFNSQSPGAAYDPRDNTLWVLDPEYTDDLVSIDLTTLQQTRHGPSGLPSPLGLSYDRNLNQLFAVGLLYGHLPNLFGGVWTYPGWTFLTDPGVGFSSADWFDQGGYTVAVDNTTGDFYAIESSGLVRFLAPGPPEFDLPDNGAGLAYDSDTKLFWWSNHLTGGQLWMVEPENFTVVGRVFLPYDTDGGAGSIDTVPAQTPVLYVTGDCPGYMWVTVADATPGGHVVVGSDTRRGNRRVANGACAGTTTGLRRPVQRFDLVANSYGIASTVFHPTPQQCGNVLLQAMDVDTCLTTQVQVADMILPP